MNRLYLTGAGAEVVLRLFRIYTALDNVTAELYILLLILQGKSCGDVYLRLYKIHAGHHFGYGVFDLYSCVHLHKVEV